MSESMVERVARALHASSVEELTRSHAVIAHAAPSSFEHLDAGDRDMLLNVARAAIAAMREPSSKMIDHVFTNGVNSYRTRLGVFDFYREMIDAALSE